MNLFGNQPLKFGLKSPCDDCPFTCGQEPHEGLAYSVETYLHAITSGRFAHTCHKTDPRADGHDASKRKSSVYHCAGALEFITANELPVQDCWGGGLQDGLDLEAVVAAGKLSDRVLSWEGLIDWAEATIRAEQQDPMVGVWTAGEFSDLEMVRSSSAGDRQRAMCDCGKPAVALDKFDRWPLCRQCNGNATPEEELESLRELREYLSDYTKEVAA